MAETGMTKTALRRKKAITDEHFVPADEDQAARLKFAEQRLALARFSNDDKLEEITAATEAVRDEVRKTGVSFVFRGIGRVRFEELQREHPPTAEQTAATQATFNPDTFYAALLAETVVGNLTAAEWQSEFLDSKEWGAGEIHEIRTKAMAVNTGTRIGELGN